jgi:predicted Fe-Mo cluster-binding NifX family protein
LSADHQIVLEKFFNRLEAEMAAGILEAEGIEAVVLADDAGGAYPPLQMARGVRLLVAAEDEARARDLLAAWRQGPPLEAEDFQKD